MTTTYDPATSLSAHPRGSAPDTSDSADHGPHAPRVAAAPGPLPHRSSNRPEVPRGWGSHEERRTILLALAAFVALGLYAAGFVLLGQALSS